MRVFVGLIGVATLCVSVSAQNGKLTASEVNRITSEAYARLRAVSHHVSYSEEESSKVGNTERGLTINEITKKKADGSFHTIRHAIDGESKSTTERIVIAGRRFIKSNEQPWAEEVGVVGGSGIGGPPGKIRAFSSMAKVDRDERINGTVADKYQVSRHSVFERSDGKTDISDSFSHYWIDNSGRLLRTEIRRRTKTGSDWEEVHSIWDFRYDLDIKIEVPIK